MPQHIDWHTPSDVQPIAVRDQLFRQVKPLFVAIWIKNDGHPVVDGQGHLDWRRTFTHS
jgi:hypothetical protein